MDGKHIKKILFFSVFPILSPGILISEEVSNNVGWFYLSSFLTNEVYRFQDDTGKSLGKLDQVVPGAFASVIGENGDFFVAAQTSAEVLRFDGLDGTYKGDFITSGSGGLSKPTAPVVTPDEKYYIVGDLDLNGYYRYDGKTGDFIGIFTDETQSPIDGSFMPLFSPHKAYSGKILFASGFSNSVQVYDIESGDFIENFVAPGYGGLDTPIGMSFGPDGDLYVASSGNSSIKRYDGETGEYIGDFVTSGLGGLDGPRGIAFGGANSDLYVASNNSNSILVYDRVTGSFIKQIVSGADAGFYEPRGLTFSVRPSFFIKASLNGKLKIHNFGMFSYGKVEVEFLSLTDLSDEHPKVELLSVTSNQNNYYPYIHEVVGASLGKDDRKFLINTYNGLDFDRIYQITYRATNARGVSMIATDSIVIPPEHGSTSVILETKK